MLDALQAIALLGLIVCQYILIRGCFRINETIPLAGGNITAKIDRTADLLDEMAQLIADLSDGLGGSTVPQPVPSPMEALLSAFMSRTAMGGHASQSQEWEILPPDENPTTDTQNDQPQHDGPAIPRG
jgi:hypothetical protein